MTNDTNESTIVYKTQFFRYLVVEYCFSDDDYDGKKHILGSYQNLKDARIAAGKYIKDNVSKMKARYRFWEVRVQKDRIFFDIR